MGSGNIKNRNQTALLFTFHLVVEKTYLYKNNIVLSQRVMVRSHETKPGYNDCTVDIGQIADRLTSLNCADEIAIINHPDESFSILMIKSADTLWR